MSETTCLILYRTGANYSALSEIMAEKERFESSHPLPGSIQKVEDYSLEKIYMDLIYHFITFVPAVTLLIYMMIIYMKYKNIYFGLFSLSYFGTSLLAFSFLIYSLNAIINEPIHEIVKYTEMLSMAIIIWSATMCIVKLFYDNIRRIVKLIIIMVSILPLALYSLWSFNIIKYVNSDNILYLIFYVALLVNCVLFALKFKEINQEAYRKRGIIFVCVLSSFLIVFIAQLFVPSLMFNMFPLYYLIWTILMILFVWNFFMRNNLDKVFHVQKSFVEKYGITSREEEIVDLILKGYKNSTISKKLFISEKTVSNHLYNIYKKLDITSRFELFCLFKQ